MKKPILINIVISIGVFALVMHIDHSHAGQIPRVSDNKLETLSITSSELRKAVYDVDMKLTRSSGRPGEIVEFALIFRNSGDRIAYVPQSVADSSWISWSYVAPHSGSQQYPEDRVQTMPEGPFELTCVALMPQSITTLEGVFIVPEEPSRRAFSFKWPWGHHIEAVQFEILDESAEARRGTSSLKWDNSKIEGHLYRIKNGDELGFERYKFGSDGFVTAWMGSDKSYYFPIYVWQTEGNWLCIYDGTGADRKLVSRFLLLEERAGSVTVLRGESWLCHKIEFAVEAQKEGDTSRLLTK